MKWLCTSSDHGVATQEHYVLGGLTMMMEAKLTKHSVPFFLPFLKSSSLFLPVIPFPSFSPCAISMPIETVSSV